MIKLGYSLSGGKISKYSIKERIKILLSLEDEAAELTYITVEKLKEELDNEDIENLKRFKHLSIHAPKVFDDVKKENIVYPSSLAENALKKIMKIAKLANAKAIVFHPDSINDFKWLENIVGDLLAIENMDPRKAFGSTVKDLEAVFLKAPGAKWVCDVNHIYVIDRSMKLADEFHQAFKDRLYYYHLSGYGGSHDCLSNTHEDIILEGIKDFSAPIIHEGRALRDGQESLIKENEYILNRLKKK